MVKAFSGGKRKSGKTGKGNKWGRKGAQRAAVAVGHSILEAAYFIIRDAVEYREMGETYSDRINQKHLVRYLVHR